MTIQVETLVATLEARLDKYEKAMAKAIGTTDSSFKKIESRGKKMEQLLADSGQRAAMSLSTALGALGVTLGAREVLAYADAWTKAKNSLAVAGLSGEKQADVLDRLFQSAQANSTPIAALTDLYGKAAQASDNLGASQEDLLRFSDGIAVALKVAGTSAGEASGALQQLGQLLGSAKVQAEEFNSVNDGARPILIAVARGLDAAGGSVNKLKQIVNAGELSGKQFFDAFLRGLPTVQAMAANAAETIEQGYVRVNNALTRYIGQTDSSLGASQRLVQGLNALADNFDGTADMVLRLAAVIAGALVGRSIAGMIAQLGIGTAAILNFTKSIRLAQSASQAGFALRGLASVAGPVGAVVGIAATAVTLFATSADAATPAADAYAKALDRVRQSADEAGHAVEDSARKVDDRRKNDLLKGIDIGQKDIEAARQAVLDYFQFIQDNASRRLVSEDQLKQLATLSDGLKTGAKSAEDVDSAIAGLANADPKFQRMADQLKPLTAALAEAVKAVKSLKGELATTADATAGLTHPSGDTLFSETQKRAAFLDQRNADASRDQIDARAKAIIDAAAKLGITLNDAAARIQAKAELAKEAAIKGLDSAISGYADRVVAAESGGRLDAKNPMSSATGIGQFIESTWLDLFRKNFPDRAASMSRETILALRGDATISRQLIEAYARENAAVLQKAGVSVDEAALHLAHFLGPQGAVKVLQAAPGTPIAGLLPPAQIRANPTILGNGATVDTVRGYAEQRAGMNTPGARTADASLDFQTRLKQQQSYIDNLNAEIAIRARLNPTVNDYGRQLSTVQAAQALLTEAQKDGTESGTELKDVQQLLTGDLSKLSPAAREQALVMRELASRTGEADAAAAKLAETQDKVRDSIAFQKDVLSGALSDMRTALEDGKLTWEDMGQVAVNVLNKIADRLQTMLVDQLFNPTGLLGSLFGGATATAGAGAGSVARAALPQTAAGMLERAPRAPSAGSLGGQHVHVTVGLRKDGLDIHPEVDAIAVRRAGQAAKAVQVNFDQWRGNGFHREWEAHARNRRMIGRAG